MEFHTRCEAETEALGARLAAVLSPGVPPRGIPSVPMPRIGSTSSLSAVH